MAGLSQTVPRSPREAVSPPWDAIGMSDEDGSSGGGGAHCERRDHGIARLGPRVGAVVLIGGYVAAWAVSPLVVTTARSDLDLFFWPSAQVAAHGHPLMVYSAQGLGQYPNANGPLGILSLTPIAVIANSAGWANDLRVRAGVTDAVFAVFALLIAAQALGSVRRVRGVVEWPVVTSCVFLLAPVLWISVIGYGHVEQPLELLLVLTAAGYALKGRPVLAGIAVGLAVLTRTTALLYVVPFALVPLATRRIRPTAALIAAAAATAITGLAPFVIADTSDVLHSLVTFRGALPIAGGSVWLITLGSSWSGIVQHGDVYLIVSVAAALCAAILWRRPTVGTTPTGLIGLLTVVAACFPMLAKTVYPYYLLEPYVFASLWWLLRPGSAWNWRIVCPLLLTADALLSKQGVGLPLTGAGLVEGVISSVVLAMVAALVMADLLRRCEYGHRGLRTISDATVAS